MNEQSDSPISSFFKSFFQTEGSAVEDEPPSSPEEQLLSENIKVFFETTIREIMVPRTKMVTIEKDKTIADAIQLINQTGHSRIPVHKENRDNIVGILYAKDLLRYYGSPEDIAVSEIMRKPYFVSFSQRIHHLLAHFNKIRVHLAIVVDEYGGVAGLVTVEDVIEELIGEIHDEFDLQEEPPIRQIQKGVFLMDADFLLESFNTKYNTDFQKEGLETIGGYVCYRLGEIPKKGDTFEMDGIHFKIEDRNDRQITKLLVTFPDEET